MNRPKIRSLSHNELKLAISSLQSKYPINLVPENHFKFYQECVNTLGGLFAEHTAINKEKKRFYFMRVRTADSFSTQEQVNDPKQYTYKPKSICTDIGRAHLPHHPVLYASDSYETAIREIKSPDTDKYLIALWYTEEINLNRLNFLSATDIKSKRLLELFDALIRDIDKLYSNYDDYNRDRVKSHVRAWSDLFLSNNYTLSSTIAHEKLYNTKNPFDIICYCSAVDSHGINFAIHPRLANELILHKVYSAKVTGNDIGIIQCASVGNEGMLEWRQAKPIDLPQNDPFLPTSYDPSYYKK